MQKILILGVFLFLVQTTFAQKFGVVAGMNFCNVERETTSFTGTYITETSSKPALRTGLVFEYVLKNGITFGLNGLYSQKSFSYPASSVVNSEVVQKIHYLDIPVFVGYTYTIKEEAKIFYGYYPLKVFFEVGPSFGIAMSGSVKVGDNDKNPITFEDREPSLFEMNTNIYKPVNTQLFTNLGISVGSLRFALGYEAGLTDLDMSSYKTLKTKNLHLSFGYVHDFAKKKKK